MEQARKMAELGDVMLAFLNKFPNTLLPRNFQHPELPIKAVARKTGKVTSSSTCNSQNANLASPASPHQLKKCLTPPTLLPGLALPPSPTLDTSFAPPTHAWPAPAGTDSGLLALRHATLSQACPLTTSHRASSGTAHGSQTPSLACSTNQPGATSSGLALPPLPHGTCPLWHKALRLPPVRCQLCL